MKLSDLTDQEWYERLRRRRLFEKEAHDEWWSYYDGSQPLWYVAKILEEQSHRFPALTINWPRVIIDGIDERLTIEGFLLNGTDQGDDALWGAWQNNDLDEYQSENNVAALVTGMSYMMVGESDWDSGDPIITVEDPETMTVEIDPLTRRPVAALKVWKSDQELIVEDRAALYLPGRVVEYDTGNPVDQKKQTFMEPLQEIETSPEVPVVPFMNRQRRRKGRSELIELKSLVDAANQTATNMLAAVEHHAVPRKWALGVSNESFVDRDGKQIPPWKIATGAIWAQPYDPDNPEAKPEIGQFAASDLRNFVEVMTLIGRLASGLYGVPPMMFGFGIGDNPASADGIRASEDRWVRRIERRQNSLGAGYERVMRIAMAVMGRDPTKATRLETNWRSAATPTQGARADAAMKTLTTGIADLRQARIDYGYSLTQIKAMERREAAAAKRSANNQTNGGATPPDNSETEAVNVNPATGNGPAAGSVQQPAGTAGPAAVEQRPVG